MGFGKMYEKILGGIERIGGKVAGKTPQLVSQPTVEKTYGSPHVVTDNAEVAPAAGSAGKGQGGGPKDAETSGHLPVGDKVTATLGGGGQAGENT